MDFFVKAPCLNLERTLFCGQAFRWKRLSDTEFSGIAGGRFLRVRQEADGITFVGIDESDRDYWLEYFDIATDYGEIIRRFSRDPTLKKACEFSAGIRVLKQEPFETLISFIISQNNNIGRIAGIVERLCVFFGEETADGYLFPEAKDIAMLACEDLAPLRAGFRAKYIIDAAVKIHDGTVNLQALYDMDAESAKAELLKIKGVGDKVADCVLLFAYGKTSQVPKDVWIKRVMTEFYPRGLPECVGEYSGIAQQFLFDYVRNTQKIKK